MSCIHLLLKNIEQVNQPEFVLNPEVPGLCVCVCVWPENKENVLSVLTGVGYCLFYITNAKGIEEEEEEEEKKRRMWILYIVLIAILSYFLEQTLNLRSSWKNCVRIAYLEVFSS